MALKLSTGLRNSLLDSGSLKTAFNEGALDIYSGSQPSNADATETGTLLVRISVSSGTIGSGGTGGGTAGTGVGTDGLKFGTAAAGVITKNADTWSGLGIATGTAGWWRFYSTEVYQGSSGTAVRMDGDCGLTNADLIMADLSVTEGGTTTINSFSITIPAY